MLEIEKIDHVGIRVSDKNRAVVFYQSLGYQLMSDVGFDRGHPVILQHPSGVVLNLLGPATQKAGENVLMDEAEKYPGYTHMALHIKSATQTEKLMEKLDIAITGRHKFKGIVSLFIRDPDRNVIELVEHTGPDFFTQTHSDHHH